MTEHNVACMVCGEDLLYEEVSSERTCDYCSLKFTSSIVCTDGHFICDSCHSTEAIGFLTRLAQVDQSTDPMVIVDKAISHPSFKFHGPEHHSLVPAAVLTAMKNRGITRPDGSPITTDVILEGIRRGSKIPGGFCGSAGTCGACVGAGVTTALFVGSTPIKGPERKMAQKATTTALFLSQDGLKRCCKRATYYGMKAALDLLKEQFGIDLGDPPELKSCKYSTKSKDCEEKFCQFYKGDSS